jgi:hypothetical protein
VDQNGLPGPQLRVVDQRLPRRQPGDRQRSGDEVVDIRGKRREVASRHGGVFGQRAVASPVDESEHPLADGEAGRSIAQLDDDTRQLVAGHGRRPVVPAAIDPGCWPLQLARGEAGRMDLHDDIVLARLRAGQLRQGEAASTRLAIASGNRFHDSFISVIASSESAVRPASNLTPSDEQQRGS